MVASIFLTFVNRTARADNNNAPARAVRFTRRYGYLELHADLCRG